MLYLMKTQEKSPQYCEVTWADVREEVAKINLELASIIDEISPDKHYPLIKVRYSFGDKIFEKGRFTLLDDIKKQPNSLNLTENLRIQHLFSYSKLPFGIFLNKSSEVYIETQNRIIPLFILQAGDTVNLYETLNLVCNTGACNIWDVVAGARSLFMLPKINNNIGHRKLAKEFSLTKAAPKELKDQWGIFVEIANLHEKACDWHSDVLFFTSSWFNKINENSLGWIKLREYLFKECWRQSGTLIEKTFSFVLQQFSSSTTQRRFKPRIYVTDTIRHLVGMAFGFTPGFAPGSPAELLAPSEFIKKVYTDVYQLKSYMPTLIEPQLLNSDHQSIYYSLGYPTLLEGHPETANVRNTIADLREIKLLMQNMYDFCRHDSLGLKKFDEFIREVNFEYFHKMTDIYREIKDAGKIILEDHNFAKMNGVDQNDKQFCSTGPFLNGCIRIHRNFEKPKEE